ncbi:glucose-1-phosphate adenylyltransferase [Cutibacterium acnes JCM 18916]|nr:glucose-1-phosphate adenylyltransferase [Cutibacterium acnes JCM 18916]
MPLTMDRAKPAVPFGGTYRLIDFVLSNLANSGLTQIAVLTQYKSHSLDRHISITWRMSTMLGSYVTPVPAQQRLGPRWYQGSADAIYQSLNLINDQSPDYVVVFGADNIYRMDVDAMLQYHIDSGLGCTVAGIRVPRKDASAFGIIDADQNHKITEFLEKNRLIRLVCRTLRTSLSPRWVTTSSAARPWSRPSTTTPTAPTRGTTWVAMLFRDSSTPLTRRCTTFVTTRFLATLRRMPTTGGTWAPLMLTTTRTWIWSRSSRSSTCTTRTGPSGPCRNRPPVPSS